MDPFKVLGVSARQLKQPSDLDEARHRAKQLFKRYSAEKKKFDAKKVLEAFNMLSQQLKNKPGEGQYKILGRSRKERELDKHFNHQTKEIKKDKGLKKALRQARRGEKRLHLPGDKEHIPRPRRKRRRKSRTGKATNVNALQGLHRLAACLQSKQKFSKVIKLLRRWMKEYMNVDNREYVLVVLKGVVKCEFLTDDPDSRQDVIEVFEYVLGYFSAWFDSSDNHRMLGRSWQVAVVLACRCFTDDAFTLSSTIAKLNEALAMMEKHRDQLEEAAKLEEDVKLSAEDTKLEKVKEELGMAMPGGSPSSFAVSPWPSASPASDAEQENGKDEDKKQVKEEIKQVKTDIEDIEDLDDVKDEIIDSDDEVEEIDDEDELIELGSEDADIKEEEISSDSSECESDGDIEECSIFSAPMAAQSLVHLRAHFVDRCLATLFQHRTPLWAKPKIDAFFQDVFYRRSIFAPEQQTQIEAWQARIKTLQKSGERSVGEANNPLEAHRPVIDSREVRTIIDSDSNAWAAKQTFDSRDRNGARQVIR